MGAVLLAILVAGCNDSPSAPNSGTVRVTVLTSGGDPDFDGYEVVVNPARRSVDANGTAEFRFVGAGAHSLSLEGVAENCSVVGDATRSVTVTANETTVATFEIVCAATGIAVAVRTTGVDIPDSVDFFLNDEPVGAGLANGVAGATRLRAGKYDVRLAFRGTNCSVAGSNGITVDVTAGAVTRVEFEAACTLPVRSEEVAFVVDTMIAGVRDSLVEVVRLDGSGGRVLRRGHSPVWSPDGTRVLYSDTQCGLLDDQPGVDCFGGLVIMDPELGSLTIPLSGGQGTSPSWGPVRDSIAFMGCCDTLFAPGRLFIGAPDAASAREIEIPQIRSIGHPVWSPDGRHIAFTCVVLDRPAGEAPNGDICAIDGDGSSFRRLTTGLAAESDPAWSPDGSRIAFTRGTDVVLLTFGDGSVTRLAAGRQAAWSPDGSAVVFVGADGLFVVNADGSGLRRLTAGVHSQPTWRSIRIGDVPSR
jgi:hypothetical protein